MELSPKGRGSVMTPATGQPLFLPSFPSSLGLASLSHQTLIETIYLIAQKAKAHYQSLIGDTLLHKLGFCSFTSLIETVRGTV